MPIRLVKLRSNMYRVYDSYGEPLKWRFSSWNSAHQFRCLMGRPDWKIVEV